MYLHLYLEKKLLFVVKRKDRERERERKDFFQLPKISNIAKREKLDKPCTINIQNMRSERIVSYRMQTRDRRCRGKVKQIATNGINDGIRDTLYRTPDFPAEQKCHLDRRLAIRKPVKRSRDVKRKGASATISRNHLFSVLE